MTARKSMTRVLPLLREYRALERKRVEQGVTPLEFQRWLDLQYSLQKLIPQGDPPAGVERRRHLRVPTRLLVQFRSRDHLREAIIHNISPGGLFINTPFGAEIGAQFTLCIRVDDSREAVDVPCEVVSNNVGDGFSTGTLGMGVKFKSLDAAQQQAVDRLFASVAAEGGGSSTGC